jgi:aminopeptidase N
MRHHRLRRLAAAGGVLCLAAAVAPAAQAATGVGTAPGADAAGTGFGPAASARPSGPSARTAPAAPRARFSAGAPGIGDPYFPLEGNGGYDVRNYRLTFSYDPATDRLDGVMRIRARATQDLSSFDLDLQQLEVTAVTVGGKDAQYTRDGQELKITPRQKIKDRDAFVTEVTYGGVPQTILGSPIVFGSPYGFLHTPDGAFQGDEPNAASTWMPLSDHPADKATWTFRVTVPAGISAIANGELVSQSTRRGRSTFVWREDDPMATYLATVDIGNWIIRTGLTPGGIPETVAVDPTLKPDPVTGTTALDFFYDTTAEATDLWTQTFGPYPFGSTGAIADNAIGPDGNPIGFSLETQTRPLYSAVRSTSTIAHELAHQWFGDSVSVQTWPNIWLNEGFATFSQYLWDEHKGVRTAQQAFDLDFGRPADSAFWSIVVADPQRDTMFAGAVYRRGGMTLQALRKKIGDEPFFRILKTWTAEHRHGNATTAQFIALSERISGQDLANFFQVWLYTPSKPTTW